MLIQMIDQCREVKSLSIYLDIIDGHFMSYIIANNEVQSTIDFAGLIIVATLLSFFVSNLFMFSTLYHRNDLMFDISPGQNADQYS